MKYKTKYENDYYIRKNAHKIDWHKVSSKYTLQLKQYIEYASYIQWIYIRDRMFLNNEFDYPFFKEFEFYIMETAVDDPM